MRAPLPARPLNTAPRLGTETRIGGTPRPGPPIIQAPKLTEAVAPTLDVVPAPPSTSPPSGPDIVPEPRFDSSAAGVEAPPASTRGAGLRYLVLILLAILAGGVAFEAWILRDRPEQVSAMGQSVDPDQDGKVADRASPDHETQQSTTDATAAPIASTAAPTPGGSGSAGTDDAQSHAGTQAQVQPEASPPTQGSAPQPAPPAVVAPEPTQAMEAPTLGVAERAALLVAAPEEPQKVRTYPGSVVWKTKSVNAGQGQPLTEEILADVTIPGAKLDMTMIMQRNTEPQLSASHTIEFRFVAEAGGDIGAIKQIDVPLMRLDDGSPTGDPMIGLAVSITDNDFLVGLARGKVEAANVLMLQKRNWIDVPMLLASGKPAKITFEKGNQGQRIIDQTIKAWQSGG